MKKTILSGLLLISTITSLHAQIYTPNKEIKGTSGNNYVGIGVIAPAFMLDVNGTINTSSETSGGGFRFNSSSNNIESRNWAITSDGYNYGDFVIKSSTTQSGVIDTPRLIIKNNGNVGIGTTNPVKLLDIQNSNVGAGESYIWIKKGIDATNVNREAGIILGTGAGDYGNTFKIVAMSSTGYFDAPKLNFKYTNPGGGKIIDLLTFDSFGKVGIGTINPDAKLTVNGNIHAQEVKIDLLSPMTVPDYVFANDYKLKSLKEVEDYINKNSHLPEIPSAKEFEKNGLMLAEMNMSLLKKVEELTLYMIEQNKLTIEQNKRIEKLESENKKLSKKYK